jgi:hypothetical protein
LRQAEKAGYDPQPAASPGCPAESGCESDTLDR